MLLLIDNYDSFTYNLVQYFQMCGIAVEVVRNDAILPRPLYPEYLVISPGPGTPAQAGNSKRLIERYHGVIPILGVCLGHQCLGELFGGKVVHAKKPMHGKTSLIQHDGKAIFEDIPQNLKVARYHSLVVEKETFPDCLEISAATEEGEIMGLRHREYPTEGVQFHPESIATEHGLTMIKNFLKLGENDAKKHTDCSCNFHSCLPSSRTNTVNYQTGCGC